MTRRSQLQIAKDRRDLLVAQVQAKRLERVLAKYDAVDSNNSAKRRDPVVERDREDDILTVYQRQKASVLARDLQRNYTNACGMLHQLRVNVVGELAKAQFNSSDAAWNEAMGRWFNSDWAKNCDARDDLHWSDFVGLSLISTVREGSCLLVVDDFDRDDGKLIAWESDQLVTVDAADWKQNAPPAYRENGEPMQQDKGVIRDRRGRVRGYIVTGQHGQSSVKLDSATVLPVGRAKLLKRPWRFNQNLGVGELLTASADLQDAYEIRAKELQSAKVAASFAMKVKRREGVSDYDDPTAAQLSLPENYGQDATSVADSQAGGGTGRNYDRFEALTGGYMEYMADDDDIEPIDFQRPHVNLRDFLDYVTGTSGSAFGLASAYAKLRADSSYTSFRGDMILTWRTFAYFQKWTERHVCDWAVRRVAEWAVRKGVVPACKDAEWASKVSWLFPTMPQVDEQAEESAITQRLKNARTTFDELLGPDWKAKVDKLGDQLAYIRDRGIPLAAFETAAGAPTAPPSQRTQETQK